VDEPAGCGFCQDFQTRNFGHLDYVAIEEEAGVHLLRCPRCGALYEDDSHHDPSIVSTDEAEGRWSYRIT
jgi:hypothetical protein